MQEVLLGKYGKGSYERTVYQQYTSSERTKTTDHHGESQFGAV
jgi:hypothetical protein